MHCKDVCVRDVNVVLDENGIDSLMKDWTAYSRAEYIVFRNGDDLAVVGIEKALGVELFKKVTGYKVISLPKDTVFVEDPELDVLNLPCLAEIQEEHPSKTVVVRGMFSHISFIKDLKPLKLTVIDSVPPYPSKLGVLVRRALDSGYVDLPVIAENIILDMSEMSSDVDTEGIMFPCRVSGLTSDRPTYFLDDAPELKHDVTLVGCHLSKRIFESLYKKDVKFINVCPADFTEGHGKTIVKCCKVKNGHQIEGDVAKVPWGATVPEVVDAINALLQ